MYFRKSLFRIGLSLVLPVFFYATCLAKTITVNNTNDAGSGSLRQAVSSAVNGDVIDFAAGLSGDSIILSSGHILIDKDITISGPGYQDLLISGNELQRIFYVDSFASVKITGLTFSRSKALFAQDSGKGGVIYNEGTLQVESCYFTYNKANAFGGAVFNTGKLNISKSTFFSNHADSSGGGIANLTGQVYIINSTFSGNYADKQGGALFTKSLTKDRSPKLDIHFSTIVYNSSGEEGGGIANVFSGYIDTSRAILSSSIVALNTTATYAEDIFRGLSSNCIVSSGGFNLVGNSDSSGILGSTGDILGKSTSPIDPIILPLDVKDSKLPCHPLDCGSPCLDSGDPASSISEDQWEQNRPFYGVNDIGAFESQIDLYTPLVYLGNPIDTCTGTQLNFNAGTSSDSVNWFLGYQLKLTDNSNFSYKSGKFDSVIAEVISPAGCPGYDTLIVKLFDNIKPKISNCPSNINLSSMQGSCKAVATWTPPTASDNCNVDTIIGSHQPGDTFSGNTTVVYKAYDVAGNVDSCFFLVKVADTVKPDIICPNDISLDLDAGSCTKVVTYNDPIATDNCEGLKVKRLEGLKSGAAFPAGLTLVRYQVTDGAGNIDTCSFRVFVKDTIPPTISCPADIKVPNDSGSCGAKISYQVPSGQDNCGGVQTTRVAGLGSGAVFPIGKTIETYEVVDAAGNKVSCSFTIEVEDTEKPFINCPEDIESCQSVVNYTPPAFSDNCSSAAMKQLSGLPSGSSFPVGTTKMEFEAVDSAGNKTTCSFNIIVFDTPSVDLGPDTVVYFGDQIILYPDVHNAQTYEWQPINWVLSDPTMKNLEIRPEEDVTYNLNVVSPDGCEDSDTIEVSVIYEFIIPSGFTPNSDGYNDVWDIKGILKYPDAEVEIYDRWGVMVFQSEGYTEKWDGTYNGKDLPMDTYYYIVNLNNGEGVHKGSVTIIR